MQASSSTTEQFLLGTPYGLRNGMALMLNINNPIGDFSSFLFPVRLYTSQGMTVLQLLGSSVPSN